MALQQPGKESVRVLGHQTVRHKGITGKIYKIPGKQRFGPGLNRGGQHMPVIRVGQI